MKRCGRCKKRKSYESFSKDKARKDGLSNWCRQCWSDFHRERRETDPDYYKDRNNIWRQRNPEKARSLSAQDQYNRYTRLKLEVIDAYGGQCECCGEEDPHFLTLDHRNGVPDRHRRKDGRRLPGSNILGKVKAEGFPNDYRVLCMNCNCAFGFYGFCPHQPHAEEDRRYPSAGVI